MSDSAVEHWLRLLRECLRRPTRPRVHGLRALSLRIQTRLEAWAAAHPEKKKALRLALRWRRQGGRLRSLLRPVREADVFLERLSGLRAEVTAPVRGPDGLRRLERLIRSVRRESARELMAEIEQRAGKLERMGRKAGRILTRTGPAKAAGEAEPGALVAAAAAEFAELDAANLHEFRKRTKQARYLAEQSGADSAEACSLRRMVRATGEWHDWEQLRLVASRLADRYADTAPLAALLAVKEAEALAEALTICREEVKMFAARAGEKSSSSKAGQKSGSGEGR